MTLRSFVDVAFAIFVAEYQRTGTDLLTALEEVGALGSGREAEAKSIDNSRSMEQLMGMMGGLKGSPV